MDLQEVIARGRFLMADAPDRLRVFELINGKRTSGDIAKMTGRSASNVARDVAKLVDAELVVERTGSKGPVKIGRSGVYEKAPLARNVPLKYFRGTPVSTTSKAPQPGRTAGQSRRASRSTRQPLTVPDEQELLDICRSGEDQLFEFKGQGTEPRKLAKEAAAMLHSDQGGIILYGVDDDGTIQGTDVPRQKLDQSVQNALRNSVDPAPAVKVESVKIIGNEIVALVVPPWNRKDVYQYEGRVYVRKGTNVFQAKVEEVRRLHDGKGV